MFGFPIGGQSTIFKNITISSNQTEWNLITDGFGGVTPTRKSVVTITVNAGVEIVSNTAGVAAMDLTGLPTNSKINLINNGDIYGRGGDGGKGETASSFT